MSLDDANAVSSLGEKLLQAVRNLWKATNNNSLEIHEIQKRLHALEKEVHGLKVSRGRAKAKSAKLEAALSESENKLSSIRASLN